MLHQTSIQSCPQRLYRTPAHRPHHQGRRHLVIHQRPRPWPHHRLPHLALRLTAKRNHARWHRLPAKVGEKTHLSLRNTRRQKTARHECPVQDRSRRSTHPATNLRLLTLFFYIINSLGATIAPRLFIFLCSALADTISSIPQGYNSVV